MKKIQTMCERDSKEHRLIVTKWKYGITNTAQYAVATSQHATQYICEKCFTLFDHQDIEDYYLAIVNPCMRFETSEESISQDDNEDDCMIPQNK